jgi:dihydrofolate synthase / folylpolyglutamate synthase
MRSKLNGGSQRPITLSAWLEWLETLHEKKVDLGLERVKAVLSSIGLLKPSYKIITVAGTNGKGSCVALLESVFQQAGYRVGAFTSPHLWRFNERIRVDGREMTDAEIVEIFGAIDDARGDVTLSYFEYSTIAAIFLFARQSVDIALLEVGLGGRLDAVNAVDADVSLIASIDLDHQEWLGSSRDLIAVEKAGIMRNDRLAVIGDRDPPDSLIAYAQAVGAKLAILGRDFDCAESGSSDWQFQPGHDVPLSLPWPKFGGTVQLANIACCTMVVNALSRELPVTTQALAKGITGARLPGRIDRHQLGGVEWIFDIAHNPAAAAVFSSELVGDRFSGRTFAVFAVMADKDVTGVVQPFIDIVDEWVVTDTNADRGAQVGELMAILERKEAKHFSSRRSIVDAVSRVVKLAVKGDRVLVFGSCYLVGPAMTALGIYCDPSPRDNKPARWTAA